MKELDFDELDRAVNTLMSDVSKTPVPQASDDDTTTTLDIPTTLSDDQPVPVFTPPVEPTVSSATLPRSIPAPAARRGGRFMDVVHPSSDMKSVTAPARPISRQGVTVAPSSVDRPVETTTPASVIDEAPAAPVESQAWPDPLDMVGYQREPDTTTPPVEVSMPELVSAAPLEELAAPVIDEVTPDEEQPLLTPFLSDTKVEKRPLGTNSTDEPDHTPVSTAVVPESETPNAEDQLSAMPELSPVVLPAELQTDVLSIESDTTTDTAQDVLTTSPNEAAGEIKTEATPEVAVPTGPTSIQQQYTEQPSTGDQTTGGIYDTDSYHQPLAHPAKKKSGWVWVVWVLVLLILGAAGGAIAYLYLLK
jgi:hypothetical protein